MAKIYGIMIRYIYKLETTLKHNHNYFSFKIHYSNKFLKKRQNVDSFEIEEDYLENTESLNHLNMFRTKDSYNFLYHSLNCNYNSFIPVQTFLFLLVVEI